MLATASVVAACCFSRTTLHSCDIDEQPSPARIHRPPLDEVESYGGCMKTRERMTATVGDRSWNPIHGNWANEVLCAGSSCSG